MKRILTLLALTFCALTVQCASAKPIQNAHLVETAYGGEFIMYCYAKGVTYPVDDASNVWERHGYGRWSIVGQLVSTGKGYFVVRNDGATLAASCY